MAYYNKILLHIFMYSIIECYTPISVEFDRIASDIKDVRSKNSFVDKSNFIRDVLIEKSKYMVILAPRSTTKSINLSMLRRFFQNTSDISTIRDNGETFKGLDIARSTDLIKKYYCSFPVIFIEFELPAITSYSDAFMLVRIAFQAAYVAHSYLKGSVALKPEERVYVKKWCEDDEWIGKNVKTAADLHQAAHNLLQYLHAHFEKKVFVLVDDYDCLYVEAHVDVCNETETKRIKEFSDSVYGPFLESRYVYRCVFTGVSHLLTGGFGKRNNVKVFKFHENTCFSHYYGLTGDQVKKLLASFDRPRNFEIIENYYGGYRGNLINFWSVLNYLQSDCESRHYWWRTGNLVGLRGVLETTVARIKICKLLSDWENEIEIKYMNEINEDELLHYHKVWEDKEKGLKYLELFFNSALEQGYFTLTSEPSKDGKAMIKIPNEDVKYEFTHHLFSHYRSADLELVRDFVLLLHKINSSIEENKKRLKEICSILFKLLQNAPYFITDEATLLPLVAYMITYNSVYQYSSQLKCGGHDENPIDLMLISESVGIIIELKFNETAEVALNEILHEKYHDVFYQKKCIPNDTTIRDYVLVGLNLSPKREFSACALVNTLDVEKKDCVD